MDSRDSRQLPPVTQVIIKAPLYLSKLLSFTQSSYSLRSTNYISRSVPTSNSGSKTFHTAPTGMELTPTGFKT